MHTPSIAIFGGRNKKHIYKKYSHVFKSSNNISIVSNIVAVVSSKTVKYVYRMTERDGDTHNNVLAFTFIHVSLYSNSKYVWLRIKSMLQKRKQISVPNVIIS